MSFDSPVTRELIGKADDTPTSLELINIDTIFCITVFMRQIFLALLGVLFAKCIGGINLVYTLTAHHLNLGIMFGIMLYIIGAILDEIDSLLQEAIPNASFLRKLNSGSMDYALFLFLLGRKPPATISTAAAMLLTVGSAVSEEVFFRGVLFQILEKILNNSPLAIILSSVSFGITHSPLNWINQTLEAGLGMSLAAAYKYSGYNLLVPIVMHSVYDFLTLFASWIWTSLLLPLPGPDREKRRMSLRTVSMN